MFIQDAKDLHRYGEHMNREIIRAIEKERTNLRHGDALRGPEARPLLETLTTCYAAFKPETGSGLEPLALIDAKGNDTGVDAPRWLCHLLGLRHRSAHVVLVAPHPSDLVVLQVRASWKDTAPGHLDTSVGGHVRAGDEPRATALAEIGEELGLPSEALDGILFDLGTVLTVDASTPLVRDVELISIYAARLGKDALGRMKFQDGEVSRVVLAPPDECWRLLSRGKRIAAGARAVLPRVLEVLERGDL